MNPRMALRYLLESEKPLVMPDAYDGLSARIIEILGFKAVQCSGYSMALASCGVEETKLGFNRNLQSTAQIVKSVRIPVMADGEDGFGDPTCVFSTVQDFIEVGIAGINIEDQVLGQPGPKQVVDPLLMIEKIRAAREAAEQKNSSELVVNARTDAIPASDNQIKGLNEAIQRANQYLDAGADLIFVTGVSTILEVRSLMSEIQGPLSIAAGLPYNIRSMSIRDLRECGIARVSLPTVAISTSLHAIRQALTSIRDSESFDDLLQKNLLCTTEDISRIISR